MSQEISKSEKSEKVFAIVQEVQKAKQEAVKNFLYIGKGLSEIQQEKLWSYYGEHLKNFGDFLKEIGFKHATAFNYIRIWREFGELLIYKNLYPNYDRLIKLLSIVDENNKEEWLEKAENLTIQGFSDEIKEAKGGTATDNCDHPEDQREYYFRCGVCGKWIKLKEEPKKDEVEQ